MASKRPQGKVYSSYHKGQSALVCGSASCLIQEYKEAIKHRPYAVVIAINEACSGVFADFLVSYHAEKLSQFKAKSLNPDIVTLTGKGYTNAKEESHVDYRFDDVDIGATSAGDAIQIAKMMGFAEIIMCGCPLNGGDGYFNKTNELDLCPRFGFSPENNLTTVDKHKAKLAQIALTKELYMVKSMSGFSAEIFGKLDW